MRRERGAAAAQALEERGRVRGLAEARHNWGGEWKGYGGASALGVW